jgi:putative SOS response-associated peptidase YedK
VCGRFALFATPEELAEYFDLDEIPVALASGRPRYNVAPGQAVAAVRATARAGRRADLLRWGLVPFWAKDASVGHRLINARGETLAERPAFREALRRRRCLIPASGFYEWRKTGGRRGQPFFIGATRERVIAFAGLWERWRDPSASLVESCTIVTTVANEVVAPIHDRMPVIVGRQDYARWLDTASDAAPAELAANAPELQSWPVGLEVNDPRHDGPSLIEAVRGLQ